MAKTKSFVDALVDDPNNLPDVILLNGFPGKSAQEGYIRLYLNVVLSEYYEIPSSAILHSALAGHHPDSPLETSLFWVQADAELIRRSKYQLDCRVRYFNGPIQQAQAFNTSPALDTPQPGNTAALNCTQPPES